MKILNAQKRILLALCSLTFALGYFTNTEQAQGANTEVALPTRDQSENFKNLIEELNKTALNTAPKSTAPQNTGQKKPVSTKMAKTNPPKPENSQASLTPSSLPVKDMNERPILIADGGGDGAGPGSGSGGNFSDLKAKIIERSSAQPAQSTALSELDQKECLSRLNREYGFLILNLEHYSQFKNYKSRNLVSEINQDYSKPIFVFKEKLELALKSKDAINYPYERVITISDGFCQTLKDTKTVSLDVQTLLFHELARIMKLVDPSPEYPLSSDFNLEMLNRASGYASSDGFLLTRSPRGVYAHALIRALIDSEDSTELRAILFATAIEKVPLHDLQVQSQNCFLTFQKSDQAKNQILCHQKILETYKTYEISLDTATELLRETCSAIPSQNVTSKLQCLRRGVSALAIPRLNNQMSVCLSLNNPTNQLDCLSVFFDDL